MGSVIDRVGRQSMKKAWEFSDCSRPLIEFFRGLKPEETDVILSAARPRRFPNKSIITYQGEPADHLFLMWKGRARYFFETSNGKRLILAWITPGHMFGVAALATRPSAYVVSSEAVRDSIVLTWTGPAIRSLAKSFPQLHENAVIAAQEYITWYVAAHAALTSQTAREGLAQVLLGYASGAGHESLEGVELDVTNEELANAANISPYTTSRLISAWQKAGAIRKRRRTILVRCPEKLFLRTV
jgi:CRP-like cAMP-binding protein